MPRIERTEPPYMQVVKHFRDEILAGRLQNGDTVPPVRQIARDWEISHATAAKVITTLRSEGLVRTTSGSGTVVAARQVLHQSAHDWATQVDKTGRIYPQGYYAKIYSAEMVTPPSHITDAFDLEPGMPVICRRRTTYSDTDEPLSTSISWFDGSLAQTAPLLLTDQRIVQGTFRYILEATGRAALKHYVEVMHAAGNATPDEAQELLVPVGDAVERTRNFFRDEHGDLIEYGESVYRKDVWSYYHTAPRNGE